MHALSAQMAQQFGQHLSSLHLQPPSAGSSSTSSSNTGGPASQAPNSPRNPSSPSGPSNVEVKVHMVQMPPGAVPLQFPPPPFTRPFKKDRSADNKTPLAVDKAAPSAIDKAVARDKPPAVLAQNLPGPFFRGLKKRSSADLSSGNPGANGKNKGLKGRPSMSSPANKPDLNQGNEVVEAEYANAFSPSGVEITSLFVDYPVSAPSDVTLKALWERLLDDEVAGRILKLNRKVVGAELRRNKVKHAAGAIRALDQILRRQV